MRAWTEQEDETLKRMWSKGYTAGEIAAQLPGRSRNAILGHARRIGCEERGSPIGDYDPDTFGGEAFQRIIDIVVDAPANKPISVARAAVMEKMHPDVANGLWTILCRRMGPQATPGNNLERYA